MSRIVNRSKNYKFVFNIKRVTESQFSVTASLKVWQHHDFWWVVDFHLQKCDFFFGFTQINHTHPHTMHIFTVSHVRVMFWKKGSKRCLAHNSGHFYWICNIFFGRGVQTLWNHALDLPTSGCHAHSKIYIS